MVSKRASSIFDLILNVLATIAACLIGAICVIVTVEVVARYFFNRPQEWVLETTEYSLLWITFLASAWVLRNEQHVKIDIVVNTLKIKGQALLNSVTSFLSSIVCLIIFTYGAIVNWDYYHKDIIIPKTLQLPKSPLMAIITIGALLLSIQFMRRANAFLSVWREAKKKQK
jgi:TRAP-type C4-dicarboxylate transport system permease small subunit